ncbi:MAG: hypothetical protein HZC51_05295 [Nitrospirae bacterium]|nr:hypothetical protein [Nitrospirota bacterium]
MTPGGGLEQILVGEIRGLIHRLILFLGGPAKVEALLLTYKESLESGGHAPEYVESCLKKRHPWWETLEYFVELDHACKTISDNLTPELELLAADALMVNRMRKGMPAGVRTRLAAGLTDYTTANGTLYELATAWRYFRRDHAISWGEGDDGPGFSVDTGSLDFDVACGSVRDAQQDTIRGCLDDASERMRGRFRPGLIACYIDGQAGMEGPESSGVLSAATGAFFAGEDNAHVAAVMFGTWTRAGDSGVRDAAVFRNPSCGYDVEGFDFL